MKGQSKIAFQSESQAFYADISLKVERIKDLGVIIDPKQQEYEAAITLASDFLLRNSKFNGGLDIEILDLKTNEVDTDSTLVSIVTYQALCIALNIEAEIYGKVYFDFEKKQSVFSR